MKTIKRVTALAMAGMMVLSFAGCGKGSKSNSRERQKLDSYKVSQEAQFDYMIDNAFVLDNVLYGGYETYDDSYEQVSLGLVKYDFETHEKKETDIEVEEGYMEYIQNMYVNSDNNIVVNSSKYTDVKIDEELYSYSAPVSEDSNEADSPNDDNSSAPSNSTASSNDDHNSDAVNDKDISEDDLSSDMDMPEEFSYTEITYIYSKDLELISKDENEENADSNSNVSDDEWINATVTDNDGNVIKLISTMDDEYRIVKENQDGNEIQTIPIKDFMAQDLIKLSGGEIIASGWGDMGEELYKIDFEKGEIGDKFVDTKSIFNIQGMYPGNGNSLLINNDGYLSVCDGDTGKVSKVLKYLDCDINPDNIGIVFIMDENTYGILITDYDTGSSEIDLLTKQNSDEVVKKEEIHFATLYVDDDVKKKIIQFNKTNEQYKIVIDEYFDSDVYTSETGYEDALKRFNSDIVSDNGPDMIDLTSIDIKRYSDKGILEDLTPYLEKDSELSEDDFIDSIINVYKENGKLYTIPTTFTVEALVGAKSLVGDETSWTIDEFIDFVKGLPEGMDVLETVTSDRLLSMILSNNLDYYIDWSTGNCNFNSDEFVNLLELCSNYKTSEEYYNDFDDEDWENQPSEITKIRNKKVALYTMYLSEVDEYQVAKLTFGEDITVKGYPVVEGNGIEISPNGALLGINSKSKYKDVVWNFMKQLYTYDAQTTDEYMWGFPVRKDALDKVFEDAKNRETEKAPDGTEYFSNWMIDDVELYIQNPSDEDIRNIKDIINRADKVEKYTDDEIYSMIDEETASFFKGEKTAKEVADVIQSRISVYVKENK